MKKRHLRISIIVFMAVLGILALCGPTQATDYYVDKDNGSDANNGLSLPQAFATIGKAVNTFSGGDTIYITEASTPYYEPINLAGKNCSGTSGQYTKICGLPGQRPIISGLGHTDYQGKIILLKDKVYIELCNLEVESDNFCIGMGHYGAGADNCKIHNNIFRSVTGIRTGMGIQLHDATYNNEIYNNIFYNLGAGVHFAWSSSVSGNRVVNNLFYNCSRGVQFYEAVRPELNLIANNIATSCEIGFYGNGPMEDGPIYNSCVFDNGTDFQGINLQPINSVTADPMFVNPGAHDFHLTTASPCIDAGLDTGIANDFEGNPRPQGLAYDIGPYETDITLTLTDIEIIGPSEVPENSESQFRAVAHYDNNSTRDVTGLVTWSLEPDTYANIGANGLMVTEDLEDHEEVIITAEFSQGGVTVQDTKAVTIFVICPSGNALQFDGVDDYINVPDDESLQLNQTLTIEAWVKPIYDGGDYYADAIIVKGENVGWGPHFNYRIAMENFSRYTWGVCKSGQELFFHGGTPEYDKWQHLALTADGSICRAYVNGVEVASRSAPGPYLTFPGYPLQIGGHSVTGARWFSGLIDEVRVWSIARTVDQIKAGMHVRLQGDESGLVGYWNFDEGVDQFTHDSSLNGNDGTIAGAVWVESDAPVGICTPVAVDIKPGSCPNPFNVASRGVLPAAILGSDDFDVNTIDTASIFLEGVPAIRSSYEDVASPVDDANECVCTTEGPDGYTDLTLKFRTQEIVEELINTPGGLAEGQTLALKLRGELTDGRVIAGSDCVVLVGNVPRHLLIRGSDINGDGVINMLDLAQLAEYWLESYWVQ